MRSKFVSKLTVAIALPALLCLTMGMRFSGAPGDCLVEDADWMSVDGGCKDMRTGRVWSASRSTQFTDINDIYPNFDEARIYCDGLNEGGYSDWRTASITELDTASANGAYGRANVHVSSWSSTYGTKSKKTAWVHMWNPPRSFTTGITYDPRLGYSRHDVVCVR